MHTLHATCQKFLLKYFHERLKICEIRKLKDPRKFSAIQYIFMPYSWKYWRSLNLAVWPQTEHKKYWRNLSLAVAPRSVLRQYGHWP